MQSNITFEKRFIKSSFHEQHPRDSDSGVPKLFPSKSKKLKLIGGSQANESCQKTVLLRCKMKPGSQIPLIGNDWLPAQSACHAQFMKKKKKEIQDSTHLRISFCITQNKTAWTVIYISHPFFSISFQLLKKHPASHTEPNGGGNLGQSCSEMFCWILKLLLIFHLHESE